MEWARQTRGLEKGTFLHGPKSPVSKHLTKKTEQCQGQNLQSNSKVPGDSTVIYKIIYISLFGHGKVHWHKQHSHKVFFLILITHLIYIYISAYFHFLSKRGNKNIDL